LNDFARYPSLEGRVVFITGGGSGIGASLVEHFSAQGSSVAFVDIKGKESLALAAGIEEAGGPKPLFIPCDLLDIEALRLAIAQTADALGPIRVLVNNAAEDTRHDVGEVTVEYWDGRMAVNLRHQFFAAQAVAGQMKAAGGGSIINFGSISWMFGQGGMPGYTTAKAAVLGLTRGLARDFGPDDIRVNTVSPGWVMTERQIDMWLDEAAEKMIGERQCLKDKLSPPDVARMVLFLAADDGRMCTAQNFIVDAGWV
jgi:NAD(P)-dependent dehydrogenase (short-subunit alcohol dehydrogenase family)